MKEIMKNKKDFIDTMVNWEFTKKNNKKLDKYFNGLAKTLCK